MEHYVEAILKQYIRKNYNIKVHRVSLFSQMEIESKHEPIIIGYYPVRAKAQICRLLCEFLHIDYRDQFMSPDEWAEFRETEAKNWIIKDIPFLIDGDFVTTGTAGLITYIIEKAGRPELGGITLQDKIKIESFRHKNDLRNALIGLICNFKNGVIQERSEVMHKWTTQIEPMFSYYQSQAKEDNWYFGYITVMDFVFYELLNQMELTFPAQIKNYTKLKTIQDRVSLIPEIYNYERSNRRVQEFSPVAYFNIFKEEKLSRDSPSKVGHDRKSNGKKEALKHKEMDVQ